MSGKANRFIILTGASVLIGAGMSILFGLINFIARLLWSGPASYNYTLADYMSEQTLWLLAIMVIATGVISTLFYTRYLEGRHLFMNAYSGFIAGFIFGVFSNILVIEGILLIEKILVTVPMVPENEFVNMLFSMLLSPAFYQIPLVIALLSALCSSGYLYALEESENKGIEKARLKKINRVALIGSILIILAISFLPQTFAVMAINIGAINESHSWYFMNVTVSRPDNDTIVITNAGGQDANLLNNQSPFLVTINDTKVTNAGEIAASGLNISIDPPGGLNANPGSSVTYTGAALAKDGNNSGLFVIGCFRDGREQILYQNLS